MSALRESYEESIGAHSLMRLGLISNPLAKTNWRSVAHERLRARLVDPSLAISTSSVERVPDALRELLFERGCNVLAINGGDGTIHAVVQSTIEVLEEVSGSGAELPLPIFLLLNGGGMNMLARTFDTRGHPVKTLSRFLRRFSDARLSELTLRHVPLIEVRESSDCVRYGFIFGSELVLNALTMYERFGQGYRGLARLFASIGAGVLFETELWQRFGHLLDPPSTSLEVDTLPLSPYACAVVSTVPLTLLLGAVRALPRRARPGRLEGLVIQEREPAKLVEMIPSLLFGRPHPKVAQLSDVRELKLCGPYTLDGERFTHCDALSPISVRGSQRSFRALWLG